MARIVIVGAGVFGVTGALALAARGHALTLLDPGPLPREAAASTDVSKVVRLDYGADATTTAVMELALAGWRDWNARWIAGGLRPLFHETGVLVLSRGPLAPGGFEGDSHAHLLARGHAPRRLGPDGLRERHPAWNATLYQDGYFNPEGGWAESGAVMERLVEAARAAGVEVAEGWLATGLLERSGRVTGVAARPTRGASSPDPTGCVQAGEPGDPPPRRFEADAVVLAGGAWSPDLLPELAGRITTVAQPVALLRPADPRPFRAPAFPVFTADIAATGFYGFPALPDGRVKVANHGPGRPLHPDEPRELPAADLARLRAFLREALPSLATAELAGGRLCLYADTPDGRFLLDAVPGRPGLFVATGGSGHAFKFAPVLGELVARTVEGPPAADGDPLARFGRGLAWRPGEAGAGSGDTARSQR